MLATYICSRGVDIEMTGWETPNFEEFLKRTEEHTYLFR